MWLSIAELATELQTGRDLPEALGADYPELLQGVSANCVYRDRSILQVARALFRCDHHFRQAVGLFVGRLCGRDWLFRGSCLAG